MNKGFESVQFSRSVVSNSLRPHELQHTRPPCPSPTPRVHSNSRPSSRWCHPTISSSVVPFFSCPQCLPASESFPVSQLFAWGGQSIGVSALASVLPKNTQDWCPLEWTGWISLQSKGLSRVLSNTTVQKHQFFGAQLSSQSNSHIYNMTTGKTVALTRQTFFTNYAKAFDCVDHNKLWKILKVMGIPDHLTCPLRNLYACQEATVRMEHGTTDWF